MKAKIQLFVALLALGAVPGLAQEARQKAWELLKASQELIHAGKYEEAEKAILQARDADPKYPEVYSNLGYLYAARGDRTKAVDAYGQLLALRPDDEYGRQAFRRLFFDGPFPRALRADFLAFSPVALATDEVRLLGPAGETRRLAYTTSLLFHEAMGRGQGPVSVPLPVAANKVTCPVNRSCYGFVLPPDSDRYSQALALSFPSATISAADKDYQALASRLVHVLLRFYWYSRAYLGRDLPAAAMPLRATLCERGPAGAESYQEALYFYDVGTDRSPVEWARQAGHELGHLVLPAVGRFSKPEAFANGYLGERLFMQYLALEAGLAAGEPWPSAAAQQAAAGLWPDGELKLQEYLTGTCRASLDYWAAAGPESPLAAATADDGMQHFIGFMLWVQAAYGPDMLRQVLQTAGGSAPADFVLALKQALKKQAETGPLALAAGALTLPASKLAQKPAEGALGRANVQVAPGDTLAFHAYLPEGAWVLTTAPALPGLSVTLDGRGPLPVDEKAGLALGRLPEGWHTVILQAEPQAPPFVLEKLVFSRAPEA